MNSFTINTRLAIKSLNSFFYRKSGTKAICEIWFLKFESFLTVKAPGWNDENKAIIQTNLKII